MKNQTGESAICTFIFCCGFEVNNKQQQSFVYKTNFTIFRQAVENRRKHRLRENCWQSVKYNLQLSTEICQFRIQFQIQFSETPCKNRLNESVKSLKSESFENIWHFWLFSNLSIGGEKTREMCHLKNSFIYWSGQAEEQIVDLPLYHKIG